MLATYKHETVHEPKAEWQSTTVQTPY